MSYNCNITQYVDLYADSIIQSILSFFRSTIESVRNHRYLYVFSLEMILVESKSAKARRQVRVRSFKTRESAFCKR